jgi:hypothetical protein
VQFEREHLEKFGPFDAVMLFGLLHHLDDGLARNVLGLLAEGLAPDGRMATIDPCLTPDQSRLARWVALSDRGRFVRGETAYRQLVSEQFAVVDTKILNNVCRIPSTELIMRVSCPRRANQTGASATAFSAPLISRHDDKRDEME